MRNRSDIVSRAIARRWLWLGRPVPVPGAAFEYWGAGDQCARRKDPVDPGSASGTRDAAGSGSNPRRARGPVPCRHNNNCRSRFDPQGARYPMDRQKMPESRGQQLGHLPGRMQELGGYPCG